MQIPYLHRVPVPDGWTQVNNVLWTNSSPNAEFNNQSVSLNDNINNYTYYEIIFSRTNGDFFISTGKIPTNKEAMLSTFRQYYYVRSASPYTTSITFGNSAKYNNYGSSTSSTDNNYLIPYMVLGYK